MTPASAAARAASAQTAISAGSATVAPKPRAKANASKAVGLPLRTNPFAMLSPRGNNAISSPATNRVNPAATHNSPARIVRKSSGAWPSTRIWKKAITVMIGARSRMLSPSARTRLRNIGGKRNLNGIRNRGRGGKPGNNRKLKAIDRPMGRMADGAERWAIYAN